MDPAGLYGGVYSTRYRAPGGPLAANTQTFEYVSTGGHFPPPVRDLPQTDITEAIRDDFIKEDHFRCFYDHPLGEVLGPIQESVGMMTVGKKRQTGSCTLISSNFAIASCHSIEGHDIRDLQITFGYAVGREPKIYRIENIVEYDSELDYAIIQLEGNPGQIHHYPKLDPERTAYAEPALLHHPLGKPLQLSIRSFVQDDLYSSLLSTFHDSDYGSSGGAYVDPSGTLIAIHLGSECPDDSFRDFNLVRLALPILEIIAKRPHGILSRLAYQELDQSYAYEKREITGYLEPVPRKYIDLEKYEPANFYKDEHSSHWYWLRKPDDDGVLPGVIIDPHQRKHLSKWPGDWDGGSGSMFPKDFELDDLIKLVDIIVAKQSDIFDVLNPTITNPPTIYFSINKKTVGKDLYQTLHRGGIKTIGVSTCFNRQTKTWELHCSANKK